MPVKHKEGYTYKIVDCRADLEFPLFKQERQACDTIKGPSRTTCPEKEAVCSAEHRGIFYNNFYWSLKDKRTVNRYSLCLPNDNSLLFPHQSGIVELICKMFKHLCCVCVCCMILLIRVIGGKSSESTAKN